MPNSADDVRLSTDLVGWPRPPGRVGASPEEGDVTGEGLGDVRRFEEDTLVFRGDVSVPGRLGCGRRMF